MHLLDIYGSIILNFYEIMKTYEFTINKGKVYLTRRSIGSVKKEEKLFIKLYIKLSINIIFFLFVPIRLQIISVIKINTK